MFSVRETDETIQPFPVATITPFGPLARMAKGGPTTKFGVQLSGHLVEDNFGTASFVVIGPASNDGIELANQPALRAAAIVADNLFQLSQMAFDGFLAGSNQGLETGLTPVGSGFVAAHWVLSDVEPQKVEPGLSLVFVEGVTDARFSGVELQSHLT